MSQVVICIKMNDLIIIRVAFKPYFQYQKDNMWKFLSNSKS